MEVGGWPTVFFFWFLEVGGFFEFFFLKSNFSVLLTVGAINTRAFLGGAGGGIMLPPFPPQTFWPAAGEINLGVFRENYVDFAYKKTFYPPPPQK